MNLEQFHVDVEIKLFLHFSKRKAIKKGFSRPLQKFFRFAELFNHSKAAIIPRYILAANFASVCNYFLHLNLVFLSVFPAT